LKLVLFLLKKNQKHDMRDKIENYKNFDKKAKEKNKESQVERPNWKTYIYKLELND